MHNTSIERTDQYTHLGLVLTSNFKWNKHIEKFICKASKRIALLNRVRLKSPVVPFVQFIKVWYYPLLNIVILFK